MRSYVAFFVCAATAFDESHRRRHNNSLQNDGYWNDERTRAPRQVGLLEPIFTERIRQIIDSTNSADTEKLIASRSAQRRGVAARLSHPDSGRTTRIVRIANNTACQFKASTRALLQDHQRKPSSIDVEAVQQNRAMFRGYR